MRFERCFQFNLVYIYSLRLLLYLPLGIYNSFILIQNSRVNHKLRYIIYIHRFYSLHHWRDINFRNPGIVYKCVHLIFAFLSHQYIYLVCFKAPYCFIWCIRVCFYFMVTLDHRKKGVNIWFVIFKWCFSLYAMKCYVKLRYWTV